MTKPRGRPPQKYPASGFVGARHGTYEITGEGPRDARSRRQFHAMCGCGSTRLIRLTEIVEGRSTSCAACAPLIHGHARQHTMTPEYRAWVNMKTRCYVETARAYPRYGGRGIKVCDRWLTDFPAFLADMGPRPSDRHSINRRDNDGDYAPDNCGWATATEQGRNRRTNVILTAFGKSQTIAEWAEETGFERSLFEKRLARGWPADRIVSEPPNHDPSPTCARGHEYTAENTGFRAGGARVCRLCSAENSRRSAARKRAAQTEGGNGR